MQQAWFKNWFNSPYYHLLYFKRDEKEAAAFIDKLIDYLKPLPNSNMLDVACGKGRHALQLATKGFKVTGIDLSEESIADALQYQTKNLHFYKHDMRLPFYINYFDYAFNFFTSFGYFKNLKEHENAIRTIAQSIKFGGYFVMDYLNATFVQNNFVPKVVKEIDDVQFNISKWYNEKHLYKKIIINDGEATTPLVYTEKVAKFSLDDFATMFAKQGLKIEQVFGDYKFSTFDLNNSPRQIMIAKKLIKPAK